MPVVVVAKEPAEYATWVAEQKQTAADIANSADRVWTKTELMTKGEAVYKTNCAACHQSNGQGLPPIFPALAGSAMATAEDPAAHIDIVLNGKTGSAMTAYRDILNDVDLAAVITYERNAWGNQGSVVQPADIKATR